MKQFISTYKLLTYSLVTGLVFNIAVAQADSTVCTKNGVLITLDEDTINKYNLGPSPAPACVENLTFSQYLSIFLDQVGYIILFIALIMIVGSGVQYMLSGITPEGAKQAKSRITGILSGVVLFYLVRLITHQISSGVSFK